MTVTVTSNVSFVVPLTIASDKELREVRVDRRVIARSIWKLKLIIADVVEFRLPSYEGIAAAQY